jgi:DnaJ-class molecular chaperone
MVQLNKCTKHGTQYITNNIECDLCDGTGTVLMDADMVELNCLDCKGTGAKEVELCWDCEEEEREREDEEDVCPYCGK